MKVAIRDMWADALESGEYKQGKGYLHKGDKYCCLGVLCELAIKNGLIIQTYENEDITIYDGESGFMPRSVREWADLKGGTMITIGGLYDTAWTLNDSGRSFQVIAKAIREQL